MEKERSPFSFEHWVILVFDHPLPAPGAPNWYHDPDEDSEWWDPADSPETTVAHLTVLFENAPSVLAPFSDAQVRQGLWFLVSNSCSDHMFALLNPSVPWSDRKRCIASMFTLFERFFAPRCSSQLSHLDEAGANPLNGICYMWWDILPIYGKPEELDRREVDAACLEVMRLTLDLDSDACRESALHGLGHWHLYYPTQVEALIDSFLDRHPDLRSGLKAYAWAARRGRVL